MKIIESLEEFKRVRWWINKDDLPLMIKVPSHVFLDNEEGRKEVEKIGWIPNEDGYFVGKFRMARFWGFSLDITATTDN